MIINFKLNLVRVRLPAGTQGLYERPAPMGEFVGPSRPQDLAEREWVVINYGRQVAHKMAGKWYLVGGWSEITHAETLDRVNAVEVLS